MTIDPKKEQKAIELTGREAVAVESGGRREVAELEAMVWQARHYPRDPELSTTRVLEMCRDPWLCENGVYRYQRGGQQIIGASIELASVIATEWGNFVSGVVQLPDDDSGKIAMKAYAWDIEKNRWRFRQFEVSKRHQRKMNDGSTKWITITDDRDIRERLNNVASREERNCILRALPGSLVQRSVEQCEMAWAALLREDQKVDWDAVLAKFEGLGITQAMIEERAGKRIAEMGPKEAAALRRLFNAVKAGDLIWEEVPDQPEFTADGDPNRGHGQANPHKDGDQPKARKKAAKKKAAKKGPQPVEKTPEKPSEPAEAPETPEPPAQEPPAPEPEAEAQESPEEAGPRCSMADFTPGETSDVRAYLVSRGVKNDQDAEEGGYFNQSAAELLKAARAWKNEPKEETGELDF